jgi:hypothetical protein
METPVTLVALYLLAAWAWAWLVWVADRGLPVAILVQQRIGSYTPRPLYRLAGRGRWLAAGGVAAAAAGLLLGLGTVGAVGLLAVAFAVLTLLHAGMAKLLRPDVLEAVLARLDAGGRDEPGEPLPAA